MTDKQRKDERLQVSLEGRAKALSNIMRVRVSDLSLGGCYVESLAQVQVGDHINIEIQLPNGGWVSLNSQIVYHHPNMGFGVQFTNLGEAETRALQQLIEYVRG